VSSCHGGLLFHRFSIAVCRSGSTPSYIIVQAAALVVNGDLRSVAVRGTCERRSTGVSPVTDSRFRGKKRMKSRARRPCYDRNAAFRKSLRFVVPASAGLFLSEPFMRPPEGGTTSFSHMLRSSVSCDSTRSYCNLLLTSGYYSSGSVKAQPETVRKEKQQWGANLLAGYWRSRSSSYCF